MRDVDVGAFLSTVIGRFFRGEYVYLDYLPLPPSKNKKVRWRRAYEELKVYKQDVEAVLLASAKTNLPKPPIVLLYKCYLNRESRDAHNCQEALLDALYKQDREVCPMCMPPEVDKENPRVECWIVKI